MPCSLHTKRSWSIWRRAPLYSAAGSVTVRLGGTIHGRVVQLQTTWLGKGTRNLTGLVAGLKHEVGPFDGQLNDQLGKETVRPREPSAPQPKGSNTAAAATAASAPAPEPPAPHTQEENDSEFAETIAHYATFACAMTVVCRRRTAARSWRRRLCGTTRA